MVPKAKVSPESWVEVKLVTLQLSSAVGADQVTSALHKPASLDTVMLAGVPEIAGACVSLTVMVKLDVVTLLAASVDV